MKIGIDAGALGDNPARAGNYHLAKNLILALSRIDRKNQYLLYTFAPIDKTIQKNLPVNFKTVVLGPKRGWMQFRISLEQMLNPSDVFLGFNQVLPFVTRSKSLVFVLDLSFEKFPDLFHNAEKLSWQTRSAVKKADKIIAISKSTKEDLSRFYGVEKSKIKVVALGVS